MKDFVWKKNYSICRRTKILYGDPRQQGTQILENFLLKQSLILCSNKKKNTLIMLLYFIEEDF